MASHHHSTKPPVARRWRALAALALCLPAVPDALAAQCAARSGPARNALVELYTSQGCDSCPPADRWLSSLTARRDVAQRVVAMALHVDYWDRLGWRDPFGHPAHGKRQRDGAHRSGSTTIYTPQVLIGGRDLRTWNRSGSVDARLSEIHSSAPGAHLSLDVRLHPGRIEVRGTVAPALPRPGDPLDAYLVLLQSGLLTAVASGENRGRTLRNDSVVRAMHGPVTVHGTGPLSIVHVFDLSPGADGAGYSVAAYVENRRTGEVLQALGVGPCN